MSYPWNFPTLSKGPQKIEFTAKTGTALFTSPFTFKSQTYRYQAAQIWELNVTFPPLIGTDAQALSGFLAGLAGTYGTFWFTIPQKFQLSGNVGISVSADGNDVTITSGTPQLGLYGADNTYNRLVTFTQVNGSAASIFPALPNTTTTIVPTGGALFRLSANQSQWSVDEMMEYGITVPITEAI